MKPLSDILAVIRNRHHLPARAEVRIKTLGAEVKVDGDPHVFTARITADTLDRDNEVLLPRGMDSSEFEKSGAIFWNHDYGTPVGTAGKLKRGDRFVDGTASFLKRPDDWQGSWFPDFVRAFVSQMAAVGKQVGVSVGFLPMESRNPTREDKALFGEGCHRVHSKWKLLEWSVAPVQSNPSAVVMSVGKSLDSACLKALFPDMAFPVAEPAKRRYVVQVPLIKRPGIDIDAVITREVTRKVARMMGRIYA